MNRMQQIGLGLQNHNSTYRRFPAAGRIVGAGGGKRVEGWSFLVQILPYLEYKTLYDALNPKGDADTPETNQGWEAGRQAVSNTSICEFVCPSIGSTFLDPTARPPRGALTNYKAMAATHIESLNQCLGLGKPLYGDAKVHPDGAMFPGDGVTVDDLKDGTSHTIMCAETMDDTASLWTRARDTVLVGLPTSGEGAVKFGREKYYGNYYAPQGYKGGAEPSDEFKGMRTFLSFDFRPGQADAGTYPAFDGSQPAYGPSSPHPTTVNHLMGDGSVQAISKEIDPAFYMFLITRAGGDPYHPDVP